MASRKDLEKPIFPVGSRVIARNAKFYEAGKPTLQILDANRIPTSQLGVANMEDSLNIPIVADRTGVVLDIDKDQDRFYVRLQDDALKEKDHVVVELVTRNPDNGYDEKRKVLLKAKPGEPGVFESESLMLVSNRVDDQQRVDKIPDNDKRGRDRTFQAALGGEVSVNYLGQEIVAKAGVPLEKVANVYVTILKREDGKQISQEAVRRQLKEANEAFAQAGIKVNLMVSDQGDIPVKEMPAGVNVSDGLSEEEKDILIKELGTLPQDDIHIFFTGSDNGSLLGGFAATGGADEYINNIVIVNECNNTSVLAHELAHVLRGYRQDDLNSHYPHDKQNIESLPREDLAKARLNVMFEQCLLKSGKTSAPTIYDGKRFTSDQTQEMHKSSLLTNP